jgi:hypothetical protein
MRCVLPLPVQSGYFKSDIGYELQSPFKNLIRRMEELNVFPIRQLLERRRKQRALGMNRFVVLNKTEK